VACPGCGAALAMRLALKALGKNTIVVIPACCWSIIAGPFPYSSLDVPLYHTAFETAGSLSSGIAAALKVLGKEELTVMAWAGDGAPFDRPKEEPKKDIIAIMAAHRIPYAATATIGYPDDLEMKFRKAKGIKGTRFIHLLSPCPPGWRAESKYLKLQGRFRHLTEEQIEMIQRNVDEAWEKLLKLVRESEPCA